MYGDWLKKITHAGSPQPMVKISGQANHLGMNLLTRDKVDKIKLLPSKVAEKQAKMDKIKKLYKLELPINRKNKQSPGQDLENFF